MRPLLILLLACALFPLTITAGMIWAAWPATMMTTNHATVMQDFIVMWVSGHAGLAGHAADLASDASFNAWIATLMGPGIDTYYWLYPPHILLLAAPFALLPPLLAFFVWNGATLGVLWLAMRAAGLPRIVTLAVLASPAVWENILRGQNGALMTAAMIGALALAPARPAWAGTCLAVLTLKPQLALSIPFALLARRAWRPLLWGTAAALLLAAATALAFGSGVWRDYVMLIVPRARALHLSLEAVPFGTLYLHDMVVTPYAAFRALGATSGLAQAAQLALAAVVAVPLWRAWQPASLANPGHRLMLALAAVPLVTPYAMTYDMIGPSIAAALFINAQPRTAGAAPAGIYAAALAWVWPGIAFYVSAAWHITGFGAVIYAALFLAIWRSIPRTRSAPAALPCMAEPLHR